MSLSHRPERMAALIRSELARLLVEEVSDPTLREVSITRVELTGDLKQARVFFAGHNDLSTKEEKEVRHGFKRASPFLKRQLGGNLQIRYVPVLEFRKDEQGEGVVNVLKLLENTKSPN